MYSLALLALAASFVAADLPVPRNMCGTGSVNVSLSPVLCSIAKAPDQTSAFALNQGTQCSPAFCSENTSIEICYTGTDYSKPLSVSWTDIASQVEAAFGACGAVTRDGSGNVFNAQGDAKTVPMKSFSYIGADYQINVAGNDCSNGQFPSGVQWSC